MKICLISPQTPYLEHINSPPLSLLYLNSYLKMHGYNDTQVIDLNIERNENIPEADVYAISATTPQFPYALELLELPMIRNGITIIGGAHATALPDSCNLFDKVIIGDGEKALLQCLNDIEKEKSKAKNKITNNKNNNYKSSIERKHIYIGSQVANIDDLPMPNRNDIDVRKYNYFIDDKLSTIAITSRGCPFSCHFCLPKGTLVLTEDLTYIPIEQIKVGDIVVGVKKEDHFISYERSRVLNTFKRIDRIYKIRTMSGDVQSTSDHPWLSDHYRWRKTKHFVPGQFLRKISTPIKLPKETREYKIGYIAGAFEGDGSIGSQFILHDCGIYKSHYARIAGDYDMMDTVHKYSNDLEFGLYEGYFNGGDWALDSIIKTQKKNCVYNIEKIINKDRSIIENDEYKRGYLAGIYDAEGTWPRNNENRANALRIFNSDERILNRISEYLHYFGFQTELDFELGSTSAIRILGGLSKILLFFSFVNPKAEDKKLEIFDYHLKSNEGYSQILDISPGEVCEVYNLETITGNFIADGFVTHNCQKMNRGVRFHGTEYVLKELQHLISCGCEGVDFQDNVFTMRNNLLSLDILKKMAWRCQIRADEKIKNISLLEKIGCKHVLSGIESGSQKILDIVNKKIDIKKVPDLVKECKSRDIEFRALMIIGLPSETHETVKQTIEFLREIEPDSVGIGTFVPYPGTYIYNNIEKFDIKIKEGYEKDYKKWFFRTRRGEYNCIVSTSGLTSQEILEYRNKIDREFN